MVAELKRRRQLHAVVMGVAVLKRTRGLGSPGELSEIQIVRIENADF